MAKTIVHLVHGTWPYGLIAHRLRWLRRRQTPWFQAESSFCKALRAALPVDVELKPFEWSGDNSYLGRHAAAQALAFRLMELNRTPDPPHQILVAHSHGGNVALLAAIHPWAPSLAGIATLGTPFLNVERRTQDERQQVILQNVQGFTLLLAAYIAVIVLFGAFGFVDALSLSNNPMDLSSTRAFIRANRVFTILLLFLVWGAVRVASAADYLRVAVDSARVWSPPRIAPWLILRAPGDEAGIVLAVTRLAHLALEFMWRPLRYALVLLAPLGRRGLMLVLGAIFTLLASALVPAMARLLFLKESWHVALFNAVCACRGRPDEVTHGLTSRRALVLLSTT